MVTSPINAPADMSKAMIGLRIAKCWAEKVTYIVLYLVLLGRTVPDCTLCWPGKSPARSSNILISSTVVLSSSFFEARISCRAYPNTHRISQLVFHLQSLHSLKTATMSDGGLTTSFLLALVGLAAIVQLALVISYRLFFHSLAKYPGPLVGRITDWYSVWHILIGDRHLDFYRLHQKYGSVVRYGPNRISVNTIAGLKAVHGFKANTQKSKHFYNVFAHFFHSDSIQTTIDPIVHGKKRRVLSQALSGSMIKKMEERILKHVRVFCDCMKDQHAQTISKSVDQKWSPFRNLSSWASRLTFDIMGDLAFGRHFDMLKSSANRWILDVLPNGVHGLILVGHMPALLKLKLDKILFRSLTDGTRRYEAFSKAMSDERIKQGNIYEVEDIFASLLEAKDPETGEGFSLPELVSESSLLILAGYDTLSTAMASTFFYLLHYPASLAKLNTEIRSSFSSMEEICLGSRLSSCHYMRAVIDEAMRLSPSVGGILPREVLPGGLQFDGHAFPAGTIMGTPHYAIHHNEVYYPDPFTFKPSRWLTESDEDPTTTDSLEIARSAFCPFSIGPRSCAAKALAYAEMELLLARVVWLFDIRLKEQSTVGEGRLGMGYGRTRRNEFQLYDKFVSQTDGPLIEFRLCER